MLLILLISGNHYTEDIVQMHNIFLQELMGIQDLCGTLECICRNINAWNVKGWPSCKGR